MTTASEIIDSALSKLGVLGVGETASGDDAALCLAALNGLVESMALDPQFAYRALDIAAPLPGNTASLTIGPAMAFNTPRPVRIEDGSYVTVNGIDMPLTVIDKAEYNDIGIKNITGPWPQFVAYDSGAPTGNVYFWPMGACTVSLRVNIQFDQFADLGTDYTLTQGAKRMLEFTLAEEVAADYDIEPPPNVVRIAAKARRSYKRANVVVPQLDVMGGSGNPVLDFYRGV